MLQVSINERRTARIAEVLCGLPLFSTLGTAAIQQMAAATTEIEAPRGTIVLRRGSVCVGLYVVAAGRVKLSIESQHGDEKIMALLGAGTNFGDPPLWSGKPCLATVETVVDSTLLCIAKEAILQEVAANPAFALHVIENLASRLYQRTEDIESYTLRSGTQRLIDYLLSSEPESATNGARQVMLAERKGIIASRLSLTHEHLSRILHDLAARQLIQVHGARVLIPDVDRLHRARA